ncbi:MAG: hypothetical protein EKK41_26365 [Hyphomicrobiales bacterium]|nr:MAG: hypothetical protein EKK41_26365 [Hyphomicrobiales bacterium]
MDVGTSQLVAMLARSRWLILACIVLATIVAIGVSLVAPLTYESTAVVHVQPMQSIGDKGGNEPPGRQERSLNSVASLARSDEVVRAAIAAVGPERLYANVDRRRLSDRFMAARHEVALYLARYLPDEGDKARPAPAPEPRQGDPVEKARQAAQKSLSIYVEPKTDLVIVRFTHTDRAMAAEFVNAVIDALRAKARDQHNRDEVASFLQVQKRAYDQAYQETLAKLADFSVKHSIFSVDAQRKLLLERESSMSGEIENTSNAIVEREHQMVRLSQQIEGVFPVGKYPQVRELIDSINSSTGTPATTPRRQPRSFDETAGSTGAPLLLVRVYQEAMQGLFKAQADIAGLTARKQKLGEDIEKIRTDLRGLATQAATFEQLQVRANQAREAAEQYANYTIKEMLRAEASRQGITFLDVAQAATMPRDPIFPNPMVIVPFGALAGLAIGIFFAVFRGLARGTELARPIMTERADWGRRLEGARVDLIPHVSRAAPPNGAG